jgi:twitching motility protein PilT
MEKQMLDKLLAHGVKNGASDTHFKVGDPPAYRVDGILKSVKHPALTPSDANAIALHLLGSDEAKERMSEIQEHDTSYSIEGIARFRVNIYRQRGSLSCILRTIPKQIPSIEDLQLPPQVRRLAEYERGLVLVTGATGSGKSSTLASMVDHINNTRPAHILTIEDPIEFLHPNRRASISQREVGPDTNNFTTALRAALRQDPDVILVGEMRDAETIDIALKAAETGHMVFSTVHTTDAAKTIGRLIGVFPAEEQRSVRMRLAENLRGIVSQRLLSRADKQGRVIAVEILVNTKTVEEYIKDVAKTGKLKDVIEKGVDQYGMQSFDQHLAQLYREGKISIETAKAAATNPSDFERALNYDGEAAPSSAPEEEALEVLDLA